LFGPQPPNSKPAYDEPDAEQKNENLRRYTSDPLRVVRVLQIKREVSVWQKPRFDRHLNQKQPKYEFP